MLEALNYVRSTHSLLELHEMKLVCWFNNKRHHDVVVAVVSGGDDNKSPVITKVGSRIT